MAQLVVSGGIGAPIVAVIFLVVISIMLLTYQLHHFLSGWCH